MTVTWILEPDLCHSYSHELLSEIEAQGHIAKTIPTFYVSLDWGDSSRLYEDFAPQESCVICHASFQFTELVAEDELWMPGTYSIGNSVNCSNYFPEFEDYLLNKDYELIPLNELINHTETLDSTFGIAGRLFIRPDSGSKPFAGGLFTAAEINRIRKTGVSSECSVVVSSPKSIRAEWRFVVADGEVVTGSLYKNFGQIQISPIVPDRAIEFASMLASRKFQPDRVWVLDVCETSSGEMAVVELNSFSSSNWYAADPKPIVERVSAIAIEDWKRA